MELCPGDIEFDLVLKELVDSKQAVIQDDGNKAKVILISTPSGFCSRVMVGLFISTIVVLDVMLTVCSIYSVLRWCMPYEINKHRSILHISVASFCQFIYHVKPFSGVYKFFLKV